METIQITVSGFLLSSFFFQFGFVHLSLPLYMIAQYAMASQENLLKIISKKDQEIEDYRLQNVKTSRGEKSHVLDTGFPVPLHDFSCWCNYVTSVVCSF